MAPGGGGGQAGGAHTAVLPASSAGRTLCCSCLLTSASLAPAHAQSAEQVAALARDSAALTVDAALPAEVDPFMLERSAPVRAIR
jgi:hypothetical protein